MNILARITKKTMKSNPMRTLVTIIGIVISTAMFTAVTTFCTSMCDFAVRSVKYDNGSYHIVKEYTDKATYDKWVADERLTDIGVSECLGYAIAGSANDYKPYIFVEAIDNKSEDLLPIHLSRGRMPINSNEILLPKHLEDNGGVIYNVGDEIVLNIGKRYTIEDGVVNKECALWQGTEYLYDGEVLNETLLDEAEYRFTVVGFYERPEYEPYSAPGYTAITHLERGNGDVYTLRAAIDKKNVRDAWEIATELECTDINKMLVTVSGAIFYNNIATALIFIMSIFVIIIMVGSISMIYSAFSISVSERTKQFGLLSSIGATRKQIRHAVFTEVFIVASIGIPIGIGCGILGMAVTFYFVGPYMTSFMSSYLSIKLKVNVTGVVVAAVIAFVTVIISAIIPSIRAMRVSAIEAIRQQNDIKRGKFFLRRKYPVTRVLFGTEGLLARKYFARSRKKYRVTIFSMSMSMILFIVTSSFCAYLNMFVEHNVDESFYDYSYSYYGSEYDQVYNALSQAKDVTKVMYAKGLNDYNLLEVNKSDLTAEYTDYVNNVIYNMEDSVDEENEQEKDNAYFGISIVYINDDYYEEYCKELGINISRDSYKDAKAIVCNLITRDEYIMDEKGDYNRKTYVLDVFDNSLSEMNLINNVDDREVEMTILVGFLTEKMPEMLKGKKEDPVVILPYSSKYNDDSDERCKFLMTNKKGKHVEMIRSVKETIKESGFDYSNSLFYDKYEQVHQEENLMVVIRVFSYGFITLMALICVANVFNTISTNVALRRRDFAMLKSVGLDKKGINKMMVYECLLYGVRSVIFALPLATLFSWLIYKSYANIGRFNFFMPWQGVIAAVFEAFLMVVVSMIYAINKISKNNIIEELKSENI